MTHAIEHLVHGAGIAAPVAFVAVYAVLTIALVPGSVASVAAGALFGAAWGTLLTLLGATLGATAAFAISRRLGRAPVRARAGRRIARLDARLASHGFLTVLYVRLIPLFPFNAVNYAFGLTGVGRGDYVAATALGILPATFAFVAFGSSLSDPSSPGFLLSLTIVLVLAVSGPVLERLGRHRTASPPERSR